MSNKFDRIVKAYTEAIGNKKRLVAVKLFDDLSQVPPGLQILKTKIYYCGAAGKEMIEGKTLLFFQKAIVAIEDCMDSFCKYSA